MTLPFVVAVLFFLITTILIVGIWWAVQARRTLRERLAAAAYEPLPEIVRARREAPSGPLGSLLGGFAPYERLSALVVQSGVTWAPNDVALIILAIVVVVGAGAWLRTGELFWALLVGPIAGALPVAYLVYKRQRRLDLFGEQFPEALDMISRAIRAGNALGGAVQLTGDEMPDPAGHEFRQVSEEIRLGMDPSDALSRLEERVPVEDISFFCTAIRIQRGSGGNLAEVLDRLAEVIRERFKIMSYARVLSAQHKWSAVFVGLSPVIMAVVFQLLRPGYFDAFLASPVAPLLIGLGVVLEVVGFFTIWRIAQIKV